MATADDMRQNGELVELVKGYLWPPHRPMECLPVWKFASVCSTAAHSGYHRLALHFRGSRCHPPFARPLAFQNWSDDLLPDELKNGNPLGIWRTVNNELSREPLN